MENCWLAQARLENTLASTKAPRGPEVVSVTHVVEYKRNGAPASLKVPSDLVGKKGAVLTTKSYGAAQTWLLLEPAPPFQG